MCVCVREYSVLLPFRPTVSASAGEGQSGPAHLAESAGGSISPAARRKIRAAFAGCALRGYYGRVVILDHPRSPGVVIQPCVPPHPANHQLLHSPPPVSVLLTIRISLGPDSRRNDSSPKRGNRFPQQFGKQGPPPRCQRRPRRLFHHHLPSLVLISISISIIFTRYPLLLLRPQHLLPRLQAPPRPRPLCAPRLLPLQSERRRIGLRQRLIHRPGSSIIIDKELLLLRSRSALLLPPPPPPPVLCRAPLPAPTIRATQRLQDEQSKKP